MVSLFRASEGTLAMKMVTLASTVLLLQEMKILPTEMYCGKCEEIIPDTFKQRLPELPPAGPCCQLCSLDMARRGAESGFFCILVNLVNLVFLVNLVNFGIDDCKQFDFVTLL